MEYVVLTINKDNIESAFNFRYAESFRKKVKERLESMTDEEMKDFAGELGSVLCVDISDAIKRVFIKHFL